MEDNKMERDAFLAKKRASIVSITPTGEDPVLYWHQVAQDAIHARERTEQLGKDNRNELERLRAYEKSENERERIELFRRTMPNIRDILDRVENGDFSFNLQFSFYPNIELKGGDNHGD